MKDQLMLILLALGLVRLVASIGLYIINDEEKDCEAEK
jgi:hypothetical protein